MVLVRTILMCTDEKGIRIDLGAKIEGGVHAMKTMWDTVKEEEEMGFLLIDARNAFNEGNRTRKLWTIWYLWPMRARFSFNCYRHHVTLYLCLGECAILIVIPSWEGMTQGEPLAIILYGLLLLPLI